MSADDLEGDDIWGAGEGGESKQADPAAAAAAAEAGAPSAAAAAAAAASPKKKSVRWGSAYSYNSNLRNPEDISMMWYTATDLEQFQKEKRKIIRALKHVKGDLAALEGTKYVTRGLECYQSVPFNRRIRKQRQAVVRQVLELQQQQQGSSCCNPEALGEVARAESAWARDLAHQLGLKDARTVEMGWKEFFAMETSSSTDSDSECVGSGDEMMLVDECITHVFHQTPTEQHQHVR
mmetsp:Transcript_15781/g.26427  ORF Transcript_15781/g.26427 Transcript_15781/m.26427 type:complete len:236 (-) Transcript_15781:184-891(-)